MRFRMTRAACGVALLLLTLGCEPPASRETVYQVSAINALLEGVLDGDVTYAELMRRGDFGIGTFDGLDGEMIALGGRFYQVRADGKAYPVRPEMHAPFAAVTFFEPDWMLMLDRETDFPTFQARLDELLPTTNVPCAIRVDGTFRYVKTRSVPKQTPPYPKAADIVKDQPTFELRDVEGTLIGFRMPAYVGGGLNVPGYHLHFITADRSAGGHMLAFTLLEGRASVDFCNELHVRLPNTDAFRAADLSADKSEEMHKALKAVEK